MACAEVVGGAHLVLYPCSVDVVGGFAAARPLEARVDLVVVAQFVCNAPVAEVVGVYPAVKHAEGGGSACAVGIHANAYGACNLVVDGFAVILLHTHDFTFAIDDFVVNLRQFFAVGGRSLAQQVDGSHHVEALGDDVEVGRLHVGQQTHVVVVVVACSVEVAALGGQGKVQLHLGSSRVVVGKVAHVGVTAVRSLHQVQAVVQREVAGGLAFPVDVGGGAEVGDAEAHGVVLADARSEDANLVAGFEVDARGVLIGVVAARKLVDVIHVLTRFVATELAYAELGGVAALDEFRGQLTQVGVRNACHVGSRHAVLELVAEVVGEILRHLHVGALVLLVERHFGAAGKVVLTRFHRDAHLLHIVHAFAAEVDGRGRRAEAQVLRRSLVEEGGVGSERILHLHFAEVAVVVARSRCINKVVHVRCLLERVSQGEGEAAFAVGRVPHRVVVAVVGELNALAAL